MAESASKLTERLVELACDLLLESPLGDELAASRHALLREALAALEQAERALQDCTFLLTWDGEHDQAVQWRDWQTCDLLLDNLGRSPKRDEVLRQAYKTLAVLGGQDKQES